MSDASLWPPTTILGVVRVLESSTSPIVAITDAGTVYAKVLGNPEGPEALACEWIGTELAALLGIPTFDRAIVTWPSELATTLAKGCVAEPGPAYITRAVDGGHVWGGGAEELAFAANPEAFTGLVILDTWLRNPDRYKATPGGTRRNVRNVFFSYENAPPGKARLLAIDHTEAIRQGTPLSVTKQLAFAEEREASLYGLFPEFLPYLDRAHAARFAARLRNLDPNSVDSVLARVPSQWLASSPVRARLPAFCVGRAAYVGANVEGWLQKAGAW